MTAPAAGPRLAVRGLHAGWGASTVVRGVDLEVAGGEVVAVLGGNGSGKSTLLLAVAGLLRSRAGEVDLDGRPVGRLPAERRARLGLRLLPQTRRVFPSLTVRENLEAVELGLPSGEIDGTRARKAAWLERFPELAERLGEPAAGLSGGQQQLLAIGRVLSTSPRVLLADEPSAGLSPDLAIACGDALVELAAAGAAVVLVEQNVALARRLSTRVLRMDDGRLVPEPTPDRGPTTGITG